VVIAADRPPADLESLDDRVRSRLAGGLVVEMGSLGEELRLGILKSRVAAARAHHATFDVPEPVLDYLARTITHNGRDLEGAINRLLAHSKLNAQPVTLEMAEREVRDLIRPQEPKRIKIEDIQRVVARQYNVSRGSSGEPPSASWLADTGAVARSSGAARPSERSGRRESGEAGASLAGVAQRIAVRTVRSIRCTSGISACQQLRTRSA
jgi:hypothetical protein